MILDNLKNAKLYKQMNPNFKKAFDFLESANLEKLDVGKYPIDGEDVFVLIQEYLTHPKGEGYMEAHHRFADIQIVISGEEAIYYNNDAERMDLHSEYDGDNDCVLYSPKESETECILRSRDFVVFYPNEFHMPCCKLSTECAVKKAVVKIRMD